jgi:hypothetical protein
MEQTAVKRSLIGVTAAAAGAARGVLGRRILA